MPEPSFNTVVLQEMPRPLAGRRSRRPPNELLRAVRNRLEKLAPRMIRGFPNVRGVADTGDVLQNSLIRLLRTLQTLRPRDTARLLQPGRRPHPPRTDRPRPADARGRRGCRSTPTARPTRRAPHEPVAPEVADTDNWVRFHEAVDELPDRGARGGRAWCSTTGGRRYEIAELFQVDERTIRRRWASACKKIREMRRRRTCEQASEPSTLESARTRKSPSRRVNPTRSRYSQIGTANLRVVPSRSRISATVAPGPDLQALASRAGASPLRPRPTDRSPRSPSPATPRRPRPRRCP